MESELTVFPEQDGPLYQLINNSLVFKILCIASTIYLMPMVTTCGICISQFKGISVGEKSIVADFVYIHIFRNTMAQRVVGSSAIAYSKPNRLLTSQSRYASSFIIIVACYCKKNHLFNDWVSPAFTTRFYFFFFFHIYSLISKSLCLISQVSYTEPKW